MALFRNDPPSSPRVILGAGVKIDLTSKQSRRHLANRQNWQPIAWDFYDRLGEVKFASNYIGDALSQFRLKPVEIVESPDTPARDITNPEGFEDTTEDVAVDALNRLQDSDGTHSQILRELGINLTVAGEATLVGLSQDTTSEEWSVRSIDEITTEGSGNDFKTLLSDRPEQPREQKIELTNRDFVARIWRRHPRWSSLADSSLRGVLSTCEEILILEQMFRSAGRNRCSVNGILIFPQEANYSPDDPTWEEDSETTDPFFRDLMEAMITPIQDEGDASAAVPLLLRMDSDLIETARYIPFDRPVDPILDIRMERAIRRLSQGLQIPAEVVLGLADINHWCQSEDCEILTTSGWRTHDQVNVGDLVLTLNHDTGTSEWQPVESVYRADVVNEPLLELNSRSHSSLSTSEHRWPIIKSGKKVGGSRRRWTTSGDGFTASDRIPVAAPCADLPTTPKYTDDFIRLVVAFTSDGTLIEHDNIRIAKFQQREIDEVRRLLTSVYGLDGFREHDHPTNTADGTGFILRQQEAAELLAVTGPHKAITQEFVLSLTLAQLYLFLDAFIEIGDGVALETARMFYQVEPSRLEAIDLAATLAGYKTTRGRRNQQTGFGDEPLHWLRISRRNSTFTPAACTSQWIPYTGTVWCPQTANSTWFARRNNTTFFTGNSSWQIEEATFKAHLEPLARLIVTALTTAYFRPMLSQMGVQDPRRFAIWYDAEGLVIRPNRADDAFRAHDRFAISDEALRQATGFAETARPTPEEIERRVTIRAATRGRADAGDILPDEDPEGPTPDDPEPTEETNPEAASIIRDNSSTSGPSLLTARLESACRTALTQAISRAGARVRQRARRSPAALDAISQTANEDVVRVLGPNMCNQLGCTSDFLRDGAWTALHQTFTLICDESAPDPSDDAYRQRRDEAWSTLSDRLDSLFDKWVYSTSDQRSTLSPFLHDLAASILDHQSKSATMKTAARR